MKDKQYFIPEIIISCIFLGISFLLDKFVQIQIIHIIFSGIILGLASIGTTSYIRNM